MRTGTRPRHTALPSAPSCCQQLPRNQWADSGGKIPTDTWWGVRRARTGDGERSKGSWWSVRDRPQTSQSCKPTLSGPTRNKVLTSKNDQWIELWSLHYSLQEISQLSGEVLRLIAMPSSWLGPYFTEGLEMEMGRDGNIPFWVLPSSAHICCGMGGCLLVGAQGAPCSTTCCQLSLEAPFGHWVTGSITTDLGDLSCRCSCNRAWYENMKINNSFILLFCGRQAFLFITLFIVGCYKYSRIIISR